MKEEGNGKLDADMPRTQRLPSKRRAQVTFLFLLPPTFGQKDAQTPSQEAKSEITESENFLCLYFNHSSNAITVLVTSMVLLRFPNIRHSSGIPQAREMCTFASNSSVFNSAFSNRKL